MIGKDMREDTDLSDLKYKINIQNFFISVSISATIIIGEKNKKTSLSKWRES
jgi:hypothetical protein